MAAVEVASSVVSCTGRSARDDDRDRHGRLPRDYETSRRLAVRTEARYMYGTAGTTYGRGHGLERWERPAPNSRPMLQVILCHVTCHHVDV
jgi:hypothetical protein